MTSIVRVVLLVALVFGLVFTAGARMPVVGQDVPEASPATPIADREIFGFLPHWELGRADGIDLDVLTTLAWFGLEAGPDGRLIRDNADGEATPGWAGWTSDAFSELQERAEAAGVRVVLTVERFSWDKAGKRDTKTLLADPEARAALVEDIISVISAQGAGGVNLDFEPLPRKSRDGFVRLVRELRRGLDAVDPSLQLTFDLTPDVLSFPLKRLTADGAADAAVLMGYEYRTNGSRIAGSVAPLKDPDGLDLRESVKRALSRTSAERLILGLPWYGRAWSTRTDEPGSRTRGGERYIDPAVALYRVSVPRAALAGRRYDREQASAWSTYRSRACESCSLSWRQLWYDDVDSVRAKAGLARRKGLRGVGIWALGYEGGRPELWSALRYALERPEDASPPTGTASLAAASIEDMRDGLPVVGETVELELSASDGVTGSGVALVRVATRGRLNDDGALRAGTTFPAVESVSIAMPGAGPVDEVFIPGGGPDASPLPETTEIPHSDPVRKTIRVQWRDIAGNWSEPLDLRVYYRAPPVPEAEPAS